MRSLRGNFSVLLPAALAVVLLVPVLLAQESGNEGGWICGRARLENGSPAIQAQLVLRPDGQPEAAPLAEMGVDRNGDFCFEGLAGGFYDLAFNTANWPLQPPRRVEARAGLVNRLTPPIEIQFEPGDPSVSFEESFDGMSVTRGNVLLRELLEVGDTNALSEAVRRFLPKRAVTIELNRLTAGLDAKPLVHELMRGLLEGTLPPIKTARYVYLIGELGDPRVEEVVVPFLLDRLRDGRTLPLGATMTENPVYVSDIAIQELTRYAGKDFRWAYGQPPLRNLSAINRARNWWRIEVEKRNRN